ncbi:MAG: hypothetical protein ACI4KJ_00010 [Anaerovoracaceae bacterium]
MKSAIETFMGIILIVLVVIISTCYITASIDTRHAQNFHASVISEIEASNHAESVVTECVNKAKENGFTELKVNDTATGISEVTLSYHYTIPFLDIFLEHKIVGYAR